MKRDCSEGVRLNRVIWSAEIGLTCGWRIVISPNIPQDSPSCYHFSMRNLAVLFVHFIAVLARLLGPGGVRSLVAESLLLKHQLLIVNRSRQPTTAPTAEIRRRPGN